MFRSEIVRNFIDYENTHPIDKYTCLEWNCWPLLRNILSIEINQNLNRSRSFSSQPSQRSIRIEAYKKFAFAIKQFVNRKKNTANLKKELELVLNCDSDRNDAPGDPGSDVVFLTLSGRRIQLENKLYDIFTDPLVENFKKRNISTLVWEQGVEKWPRFSNSAWITKQLALATLNIKNQVPSRTPSWFNEFAFWAKNNYDRELSWPYYRHIINTVNSQSVVFEKWLKTCGAKLLISVCWYDPLVMAATLAAKRLSVVSTELQHGLQDKDHFAYSGWNFVPKAPYSILPDYFWSWGSKYKSQIREINPAFHKQCKSIVGGNHWLNLWREDNVSLTPPTTINERKKIDLTILVTLQHGEANFANLLFEAIEKSSASWLWLVRLHPATPDAESKFIVNRLTRLGFDNVDYKSSSRASLYSLLRSSNVHITGHSTCALEALAFGIPTITVTKNGVSAFKEHIAIGVVKHATTSDKLLAEIKTCHTISSESCRDSVKKIFASNFDANHGIDQLLSVAKIEPCNSY